MKWEMHNVQGSKVKSVDLADDVYNVPMNESLLHMVIKAYLANKRQGTHATKTRSLVSGTGKKPFKQKGTGNARQGSSRSPLMPGGAICHGPQPRDYRQGINKKARQLALKVAISDKVRHKKLILVDDFVLNHYSTREVLTSLGALGRGPKTLVADERKDDFLYRSGRNIRGVSVLSSMAMNAEDVLRVDTLILSENALAALAQRLGSAARPDKGELA